jgi:EAL domain-containing protein (putative c-di-GMP-specific phosphodiesterase class I)/ActR/RegA family two-component response regulator
MIRTNPQCVLVVDDDRNLAEGLALALEREGRTVIVCADLESAELALARYPVTDVVSDVQFSGLFGFEGLHFLERARSNAFGRRTILMTGHATEELRMTARAMGAHAVLAKPFRVAELEALLPLDGTSESEGDAPPVVMIESLDEIIARHSLSIVFQPIVRLSRPDGEAVGYEALTRPGSNWPLGGPVELFDYAAKRGRLADLNRTSIECALMASKELPDGCCLFLNADPIAFDGRLLRTLELATRRADIDFSRLVLEITERSRFEDEEAASAIFELLRERGTRFALDDHGSSYSHLSLISRIRPSFVKISGTFGTGLELDVTRQRVVRHIVALARDFGAQSILEGIEGSETAERAMELGVDLAQGYHFGRPGAAASWSAAA